MESDQLASLVNSVDPDQLASEEASLSGSTVFNARIDQLVIINKNMKYRIVLTCNICTCPRTSKQNFQLVLNEMGPGRTSWAWYFHSPGLEMSLIFC